MTARRTPGRCLLVNGRVLNVFTGHVERANVLLGEGRVLGVGPEYLDAEEVHDVAGGIVLPGFIDCHVHLESSLLAPARFAEAVVPRGTTTVVADPHEIANVLGLEGLRWMLAATRDLPLEVLFTVPSCVPASALETAGARVDAPDVATALGWRRVVGLGEVMDVGAVLGGSPDVRCKIGLASGRGGLVEGHAPALTGAALDAYVAAGIESDHECITAAEAREKLRRGLRLMIREGSQAKNLRDLLPAVDADTARRCLLVTDDRNAGDLVHEGHMDHLLRAAVAHGLRMLWAVQMATLNAAEHLGRRDAGAVAPGRRADLVVVEDLQDFRARLVFRRGVLVAERGKLVTAGPPTPALPGTMHAGPLSAAMLRLPAHGRVARVIGLVPGQIVTERLDVPARVRDGEVLADPERDVAKLVVVERHRATGRVGVGLVRGFGLGRGALASSVAHDAHNVVAVGMDDRDLLAAVRAVVAAGGGLAVAGDGVARACLPLPLAGLMADLPAPDVAAGLAAVEAAAAALGATPPHPFGALSFLALPVVPALRLTDHGVVDTATGRIVPVTGPAGPEVRDSEARAHV